MGRNEEWKPVDGWPYEVSDQGRVRRARPGSSTYAGRVLEPFERHQGDGDSKGPDGSRYQSVQLWKDGDSKHFLVHRLVAAAFLGPKPPGYEIDHVNRDRVDNRAANLRYIPRHVNRGAKLSPDDVVEIRERYEGGDVSQIELGEEYGVHPDTISLVVLGKTWSDADGPISKPTGGGEP